MLDRIRPGPSAGRSTTAAAVSSQVVSMPSTTIQDSQLLAPQTRCAPSPLVGEGGEGGDACGHFYCISRTPTPNPSPQGGGEHTETAARNVAHETTRNAGSLGALSPDFAAAPSGLRCFGRLRPA